MTRARLVVALLTMLAWGCGSDGSESAGPVSCSAALPGTAGSSAAPAVCIDLVGGTAQDVANNRQQCMRQGNTFALALCAHTGASGGCRETHDGLQITTWYYADTTAADTLDLCDGLARFAPSGVTIEFVLP